MGTASDSQFKIRLNACRQGSEKALGELLNGFRDFLIGIADESLDSDMRGKVGPSDLVQISLLEAYRDFSAFRGQTEQEFRSWLAVILTRNLLNEYRFWRQRFKRQIHREVDETKHLPIKSLDPSASQIAMTKEAVDQLNQAVMRLSPEYQEVLKFRHHQQLTFEKIGELMGRSTDAVRMLWYRAFDRLSEEMHRMQKSDHV